MSEIDRLQLTRESYAAFAAGDRGAIEALLSENLEFSSPYDVGLDRAGFFERCWPNSDQLVSFEFVRLIEHGSEVVVTYESTKQDGTRFRNTEILTFEGPKICRQEVYFGWTLA